ncbi:MAG: DNA polymerase III subunit delta' [Pseudomonadota bacterium]
MPRKKTTKISDESPLPEADRFGIFPHPRETLELYGHDKPKQDILQAWQLGRMHHAWILSGPTGIGKATFAYHIARIILQHDTASDVAPQTSSPEPDDQITRQIAALSHPNMLVLRRIWDAKTGRFSTGIPVSEVRRLRNFVGMTGEQGRWRVVIIDRADEMNINAANAVLKSLEEPPAFCIFFLITETLGKLPITIRSRCRKLAFNTLSLQDVTQSVQNVCSSQGIDPPDHAKMEILHGVAKGSVQRMLDMMQNKGLDTYENLLALLQTLPRLDIAKMHALADKLASAQAQKEFEMFFMLLTDIIQRGVRVAAGHGTAPEREISIALKLINQQTLAQWAELWETVVQAKNETMALNLDRKTFILNIFQKLQTVTANARP